MTDTRPDLSIEAELLAVREAGCRAVNDLDYRLDPAGTLTRHLADVRRELGLEESTYATDDRRSGLSFVDDPDN